MAPELFAGERGRRVRATSTPSASRSTTCSRASTPTARSSRSSIPKFGEPVPPTRYRPDIPGWLENVLLKAVARDPAQRFETAEEFLLALERGAHRPLGAARRMPLASRNPALLLKLVAAASLLANLLLLIWMTWKPV